MPHKQAILENLIKTVRDPNPLHLQRLDFDREALNFAIREADRTIRRDIQDLCSLARVIRVALMTIPEDDADLSFLICYNIAAAEITPGGDIDEINDNWIICALYEECEQFRQVRDDLIAHHYTDRRNRLSLGIIDEKIALQFLLSSLKPDEMKIIAARLRAQDPGVYDPIINQLKVRAHLQKNLTKVLRL